MAVTRAADKTHDLPLSVMGLREEVVSLEDMLLMPAADDMLVGLNRQDDLVGLVGLDAQIRAALGEVQTIGNVLSATPEERPATATDCALAKPMMEAIFAQLLDTVPRTPLEGWADGVALDKRLPNTRVAGLVLPEGAYRVIRMTIDLHVEGREGSLMLALPDHMAAVAPIPVEDDDTDWSTRFQAVVNAAPVRLSAELLRFKMPLAKAQSIRVGQVVPLPGCKVTSVSLRSRDGRRVATARLGQAGGMRAIRIETPASPEMHDLGPVDAGLAMMGLMSEEHDPVSDVDLSAAMDQDMQLGGEMDPTDASLFDNDTPDMSDTDAALNDGLIGDVSVAADGVTLGGNGEDELAWDIESD